MANKKTKVAKQPWELLDQDLEQHSVAMDKSEADKVDEALELQMISIRLERGLLSNLKLIADHHGVGYQPLIRDLLNRFAQSELDSILHQLVEQQKEIQRRATAEIAKGQEASMRPIDEFLQRERKRA
jgi:predicted DNA binding CopG/RHH family protein